MSFNKITLCGRLARDPELRYSQQGLAICTFSIPDNQTRQGEEKTTWFRVSVFGKRAETLSQFLKKGSECFVFGRMSLEEWKGKDGVRFSAEINADDVQFVGKRPDAAPTSIIAAPDPEDNDVPF